MNEILQTVSQWLQIPWVWIVSCLLSMIALYFLQKKSVGPKQDRIEQGVSLAFSWLYTLIWIIGFSIFFGSHFQDLRFMKGFSFVPFLPVFIYSFYLVLSQFVLWIAQKYLLPKYNSKIAFGLYEKKRDGSGIEKWILKAEAQNLRPIIDPLSKILFWIVLATLALSLWFNTQVFSLWFAMPIFPFLILRTFSIFLGGLTLKDLDDLVLGKGKKGLKVSQYDVASEHLRKSFGKALKAYIESPPAQTYGPASSEGILSQLEKSSSPKDVLVATYFRSEADHVSLDPDYVQVCRDLMDKQNVFIQNPFYQDLGLYLTLPFNQSLMNHHKILVLCQGNDEAQWIQNWLDQLLNTKSMIPETWKIRFLQDLEPNCDLGILSYASLHDPQVLVKNERFFAQVEYVLILHPSRFLTTMQIPLQVLSDLLRQGNIQPVFCVIDEKQNGLKDTISHVLKTRFDHEIHLTTPAPKQKIGIWDANADYQTIERFDKQTRSFGGGIEIGAEAISVQVEKTCWVSESHLPLADIQDFAAQNYLSLSKVMKEPYPSQTLIRQKLDYRTSSWQLLKDNAQFLIIEDERNNPFLAANQYVSRATQEIFINILCENYLLRDYFCDNLDIFWPNPDAIPSLVPDFAQTRRNLLFKLILMMRLHPISEEQLLHEFDLAGIQSTTPKQELFTLLEDYSMAQPDLFLIEKKSKPVIFGTPSSTTWYGIHIDKFEEYFSNTLKQANVVLEDERAQSYVLDAKIYSLILQTMLPGQLVNYDGKSYQIKRISPTNGVILRRASDLSLNRKHYLQLRQYHLPNLTNFPFVERTCVNGFLFSKMEVNFSVDSLGYLEMESRGDLKNAIAHDLTVDPLFSSYSRHYQKKNILTISFPKGTQEDVYQIAILLQELLPTVLPTGYPYLAILAREPEEFEHQFEGVISLAEGLEDLTLVIVEDSDIDLGLLDEFEKHFFDLLAIVQDYIRWTLEQASQNPHLEKTPSSQEAQPMNEDPTINENNT